MTKIKDLTEHKRPGEKFSDIAGDTFKKYPLTKFGFN